MTFYLNISPMYVDVLLVNFIHKIMLHIRPYPRPPVRTHSGLAADNDVANPLWMFSPKQTYSRSCGERSGIYHSLGWI